MRERASRWNASPGASFIRALVCACVCGLIVLANEPARASSQDTYLECLTNFETYAETLWQEATYSGAPPDSGYWGDGGAQAGNNGGIRGNGGIAVAYGTLVVALPNDPRNPTRLSRIRQALNYNAGTHFTGGFLAVNGVQWGWDSGPLDTNCTTCNGCADWQSAEWAGSTGLACLLLQSNLPPATVAAVQRLIASEATHRAGIAPCSLPLSSGDTKAEENGWDGNPISLAAAWMSASNSFPVWLTGAKDYLANTYTVPNTNGDPLASWDSTVTLYPEFALVNHGFYHPTYEMVAGMSSADSLLMARLLDTNIAAQIQPFAEHNVSTVWTTNLSLMLLDSGEFAYPSGLDWELHDYEQDSYITWMAAHFNDPVARWADGQLSQLVRYRQIVNGNGSFIGPSSGGFYREAVEARRTAIAWLQWANADFPTGPTNAPAPMVCYFPDVGVIAQRSQWGFVSISYLDTIMGMVEAAAASVPTNVYVATPALPGGFGVGPLGNPTSATLVSLDTNSAGFTALLLVQNGSQGATRVYVNSCGESVAFVEVPLPAAGVKGSGAACFTNGIENDPLTGGSRLLEWTGSSTNVTNFSGAVINITNNWMCVAGRYGIAAGPGGNFRYTGTTTYDRLGAAQDYLAVIPQSKLGPRYCVWFPNHSATQTATLAGQIAWTTNGSTATLTFPGNGATQTIVASLTSGSGAWSADASGNWSDSTKWTGGNVADGTGFTADFSTVNITADRTVTLDSSRTIGALDFGDPTGSQNWFLNSSGGSVLTLSSSAPAIVVKQNTATISASLAGTGGFAKSSPGTLVLSGSNSLSGPFFLDSGSTTANDGAVRITSSAALAGASYLQIRNNSGANAASTLQLDGSQGNLVITQNMTNSCRANTIANIENIAGSNVMSGNISMQTGGSNIVFQSDAGTLVLSGSLQYVGNLTAARTFNFSGAGDTTVTGPILFSSIAPLNVAKSGTGRVTLDGANTYTGSTIINAGALSGTGTIASPVTIMPGATLSPGDGSIGTLTIANTLTNQGTLLVRLGKNQTSLTNDSIQGISALTFGGTLQLTLSGPITAGDNFQLFNAASYNSFFTNITPATPGFGLVWDTNSLAVNGSLGVALAELVKPRVAQNSVSGTNFVFGGSGGAAYSGFSVLSSANLFAPFTNWSVQAAGICDSNGNFTITNALSTTNPFTFYVIRMP